MASGIPRPKPSTGGQGTDAVAAAAEAAGSSLTPTSKIGAVSASAPVSQRTTREVVVSAPERPNGVVLSEGGGRPHAGQVRHPQAPWGIGGEGDALQAGGVKASRLEGHRRAKERGAFGLYAGFGNRLCSRRHLKGAVAAGGGAFLLKAHRCR